MILAQFLFGNRKERAREPKPRAHEVDNMDSITTIREESKQNLGNLFRQKGETAKAWVDRKVIQGRYTKFSEIITLTPEIATELLSRNPDNRKLKQGEIAKIRSDIESGRFEFNGASVTVSKDGLLNDGQHRCAAVVLSNKPVDTVIVFGVTRDARLTNDSGSVRTVADYLGMDGLPSSHVLASATNLAWHYREYNSLIERTSGGRDAKAQIAKRRPSKAEIREFLQNNATLQKASSSVSSNDPGGRSVVAFTRWAISSICKNHDAIEDFFQSLRFGDGLGRADPILIVRNRLMNAKKGSLSNHEKADMIFQAWNLYRKGRAGRIGIGNPVLPKLER